MIPMRKIDRLAFLGASAAGIGATLTVQKPALAADFNYILATTSPSDYSTSVRCLQMAAAIRRETNGRLEIKVFPAGSLGTQSALVGQLRLGSIHFFPTTTFGDLVPEYQILSVGFSF